MSYHHVFYSEKLAGALGVQEQEQPERERRQPQGRLQGPSLRAGGHRGARAMAGAGHTWQALGLPCGRLRALPVRLDARGADGVAGPLFYVVGVGDPGSGVGAERARWHVHEHDADETDGHCRSSCGAVLIFCLIMWMMID